MFYFDKEIRIELSVFKMTSDLTRLAKLITYLYLRENLNRLSQIKFLNFMKTVILVHLL